MIIFIKLGSGIENYNKKTISQSELNEVLTKKSDKKAKKEEVVEEEEEVVMENETFEL